jgi:hypothetical protein
MRAKYVLGTLFAGMLLASCVTVPVVERGWLPLTSGTGRFYLTKKYYPARQGVGTYVYSTRFYYGSSDFFRSEAFSIQKVVSPSATYYELVIDLARRHYSVEHSLLLEADGSSWRLRDNYPQYDYAPLGFSRFEERMRFRLDPAMVAQLASAAHIGVYELAGPINLTDRQRAVLQSFLKDTAGSIAF